jgi:ribonuclease HI
LSVTPSQLLLAIAEHETLDKARTALPGLTREAAQKLLRGAAVALQNEPSRDEPQRKAGPQRRVRVFSDGAARGNPGLAGAGAIITDTDGNVLERVGRFLGETTNNVAEYKAVILGLHRAQEMGAREVELRADSELVVRQLLGKYAVRNAALKPLHAEATALLNSFSRYDVKHVPREENTLADDMSNRAIDEKMR